MSDHALLRAILRDDLGTFIVKVFQTVAPGDAYRHNWHVDAIAYELRQVRSGSNKRLLITQPPRSLKSISTSVAFVAWCLGHNPSMRFACVSYSHELAGTLARQFRMVVNSDWFLELFPNFELEKNTEEECVTSEGGGRFAIPVGGSFTGRGADVIIIDDPMKAEDAYSESARRSLNEWYSGTLLSRLNDKNSGAIIVVMQRLHEEDLAGKLVSEGGWKHLNLPAIAEEQQRVQIGPRKYIVRNEGDILHPEREGRDVLDKMRREMGSLNFSAQYLQRPIPIEGNLLKRTWIKWYEARPTQQTGDQIIQSWDFASTTLNSADWSVCTTWLKRRREYYLLDVWRGRVEFPQLKKQLIDLALRFLPRTVLVEEIGPGLHLMQQLRMDRTAGVPLPIGIKPDRDKLVRMEAQCCRFEAGQVFLPKEAVWLDTFLHELLAFPMGRHDDQVDSVSQFLNWAETYRRLPTVSVCGPIIIRA
jgi:predicted phage terminase large subunit-like protein